jgi:hypothetical protein
MTARFDDNYSYVSINPDQTKSWHRRMGRGGGGHVPPPKFLRSGKKECKIRAKLKNFGKILICPENFFVFSRKLHFLVCAEKVLVPKQE